MIITRKKVIYPYIDLLRSRSADLWSRIIEDQRVLALQTVEENWWVDWTQMSICMMHSEALQFRGMEVATYICGKEDAENFVYLADLVWQPTHVFPEEIAQAWFNEALQYVFPRREPDIMEEP